MAAPPEKTLKNLTGKWALNKTISDSTEPILAIQGIGYLIRKGIGMASIAIDVNCYDAPPNPPATGTEPVFHIDLEQTASGLSGTHEKRCVDDTYREHSDWLFGTVKAKSKWVSLEEIDDDYLKSGWELEGAGGKGFLRSHAINEEKGWEVTQIWGFKQIEGVRRHARNVVIVKGTERAEVQLVYDFEA